MGCKQSHFQYSIQIKQSNTKESGIYRNPITIHKELTSSISDQPELKTLQDILINSVNKYGDNPFLGSRTNSSNNQKGQYNFKTYKEVLNICKTLGSGISNLNLAPLIKEYNDMELKMIGVMSENREEYLILDLAGTLYNFNVIAIYETLGPEAVEFILSHTQLTTIFSSKKYIDNILNIIKDGKYPKLKNLVCFDEPTQQQKNFADKAKLQVLSWEDVLNVGKDKILDYVPVTGDTIFTFLYTSGTTGLPKAAMITHNNVVSLIGSAIQKKDLNLDQNDVHLSYLPLAHSMERIFVRFIIYNGSRIGFYSGDVKHLQDDLHALKPTIFISVPRLYKRLHDTIRNKLNKLPLLKKNLVEHAINVKMANLRNNAQYTHFLYDKLVFDKTRETLGGRVKWAVVGSAPIDPELLDFLKICFCCPIYETYGQTETTNGVFATAKDDPKSGHTGGPLTCFEFKLVDVNEMGYTHLDKDSNGEVIPRGEICIRGHGVFKGYYKDPEKTRETIDEEGWLHTGDIGQIMPEGSIKIIDRKKNIFKLAIGEYIAAEKIENMYQQSDYVYQIFIYGDSLKNYLVAIIIPDKHMIIQLGKDLNIEGSYEDLCKSKVIVDKFLEKITKFVKAKKKLWPFELAKTIYLDTTPFEENDLMTPSFKLKRHEAKKHYKEVLDKLYSEPIKEEKK